MRKASCKAMCKIQTYFVKTMSSPSYIWVCFVHVCMNTEKVCTVQARMPHWEPCRAWERFLFLENLCITSPNAVSMHYFGTKTFKDKKEKMYLSYYSSTPSFIHLFIIQKLLNPDQWPWCKLSWSSLNCQTWLFQRHAS